jgi:hypothetical protein
MNHFGHCSRTPADRKTSIEIALSCGYREEKHAKGEKYRAIQELEVS